jgi:hypothetical protein
LTEHGLKRGDTIKDDMFWENSIVVKDKDGNLAKVNLDTGMRTQTKEKGGYMAQGGEVFYKESHKMGH